MEQSVIKVHFLKPLGGEVEYFFGSLAAMFERFSEEELGCNQLSLWRHKLTADNPKVTKKCIISKHPVARKSQANKKD